MFVRGIRRVAASYLDNRIDALDRIDHEFRVAVALPGPGEALVTTQTGPTCGECGSLMVRDRDYEMRCVNCRREAQPSEGTPKP
jgi:hypothetical protein